MKRNWPQWIGYLTAAITGLYGLLGVYWSLGGVGFPFGTSDSELAAEGGAAIAVNLLGLVTPPTAGPVVAAVGLTTGVVALLMARGVGRRLLQWVLLSVAVAMTVLLAIALQDYRPIMVVAYTPIFAISKPFLGWPVGLGFGDLYTWPRLNLLILLLLGLGWAMTALAYYRRTGGACSSCGRSHDTAPDLPTWGKPATYIAVVTPLIYCATRWMWALGFGVGIDPEVFREGQESGLWLAGAALASMGGLGALLTLGLIQRWGEVFPRWMLGLRGRRVPPMLAVIPATVVAVLVTAAGTMYIRMAFVLGVDGTWVTSMPETLWPLWGAALFVAALSYHRRRRAGCGVCGRQ